MARRVRQRILVAMILSLWSAACEVEGAETITYGGYHLRLCRPGTAGAWVGEPVGSRPPPAVAPELSERWALYAWPVDTGRTGTRTFVLVHDTYPDPDSLMTTLDVPLGKPGRMGASSSKALADFRMGHSTSIDSVMPPLATRTGWLLLRLGASLPIAALLLFYTYVARATLALGRLPAPYDPDPKDLELIFHHDCIGVVMNLAVVSPLLVLIARLLPSVDSDRSSARWLTLGFGSYFAMMVLAFVDPGDLLSWYAD